MGKCKESFIPFGYNKLCLKVLEFVNYTLRFHFSIKAKKHDRHNYQA
jgi:hypothetical protein